MIRLCISLLLIVLIGCALKFNRIADVNNSLERKNYAQAAVRLEKCANFGRDSKQCQKIIEKLKKSDLPV